MSPSMLEDGLYPDVNRDRYDRIDRENFSTLKHIGRSPEHYLHFKQTPPADSDAKKLGRATHVASLEPVRFLATFARWDGGTRRGKEWEAFKAQHEGEGREILTEHEYDTASAIAKKVRNHKHASPYIERGHGEVTALWTVEVHGKKIRCRGRIDFDGQAALVDLKTTRNAQQDPFGRQCHELAYVAQAAWYVDGYFLATGVRKPYKIIAVESAPPHVVQLYSIPDGMLDKGRETYLDWLDRLIFCRSQNYWPGYYDGELELTLPPWAYPSDDDVGEFTTKEG